MWTNLVNKPHCPRHNRTLSIEHCNSLVLLSKWMEQMWCRSSTNCIIAKRSTVIIPAYKVMFIPWRIYSWYRACKQRTTIRDTVFLPEKGREKKNMGLIITRLWGAACKWPIKSVFDAPILYRRKRAPDVVRRHYLVATESWWQFPKKRIILNENASSSSSFVSPSFGTCINGFSCWEQLEKLSRQ